MGHFGHRVNQFTPVTIEKRNYAIIYNNNKIPPMNVQIAKPNDTIMTQ